MEHNHSWILQTIFKTVYMYLAVIKTTFFNYSFNTLSTSTTILALFLQDLPTPSLLGHYCCFPLTLTTGHGNNK